VAKFLTGLLVALVIAYLAFRAKALNKSGGVAAAILGTIVFDPGQVRVTLGHGISNMQTRARNVGGDLEITTEPGEGTTIMAWMPYTAENQKKGLD